MNWYNQIRILLSALKTDKCIKQPQKEQIVGRAGSSFSKTTLLPTLNWRYLLTNILVKRKKGKRKVQGVPQSQTAAFPRHQEEEETDKSKQTQIK